jgi:hypothetical protein
MSGSGPKAVNSRLSKCLPLTPESGHCPATTLAASYLAFVKAASVSNVTLLTKQASGSAKIDPLMAAFNAIALMSTNPWSARPRIFVI